MLMMLEAGMHTSRELVIIFCDSVTQIAKYYFQMLLSL